MGVVVLTNNPCIPLTGSIPFSVSHLSRGWAGGFGGIGPPVCRSAVRRLHGQPPLSRFPGTGSRATNAPVPPPQAAGCVCGGGGRPSPADPLGRARLNCPRSAAGGGGPRLPRPPRAPLASPCPRGPGLTVRPAEAAASRPAAHAPASGRGGRAD